jgi:hypothetical protein
MVIDAFRSGVKRVRTAPAVLAGVFFVTLLAALPLALALRQMIAESVGGSALAQPSYAWWQQFSGQAAGVGRALSPSTVGFAAVLDNISSILDNRAHVLPVALAGGAYVLVWIFLTGGILDRYARDRRTRGAGFFGACGIHFFRLLRLGILAALVYFALFAWVHPLLFGAWQHLTLDYTVEWKAFALRVVLYALFGLVLVTCNLVFDYAKVRIVVEDRRSVVAAIAAAIAFIRRRPGVVVLYLIDGCCYLLIVAVYALVAPGLRVSLWTALLIGQAYVLARLWVKLLFHASEIAFFQDALAHAGYTASPSPSWPESPAAEAIIRS